MFQMMWRDKGVESEWTPMTFGPRPMHAIKYLMKHYSIVWGDSKEYTYKPVDESSV